MNSKRASKRISGLVVACACLALSLTACSGTGGGSAKPDPSSNKDDVGGTEESTDQDTATSSHEEESDTEDPTSTPGIGSSDEATGATDDETDTPEDTGSQSDESSDDSNSGSTDVGSETASNDTASDDTGSGDTGSEDTGSEDTGSEEETDESDSAVSTESQDTGSETESESEIPVCESHAEKRCHEVSVYWFDSCGAPEEVAMECTGNTECSGGGGEPMCVCKTHWTGENCDACVGNRDLETDCATCLPGYEGEDCESRCIRYVRDDAEEAGDGLNWENALTDIQVAIDSAASVVETDKVVSCEVWVAGGTYFIRKQDPKDTLYLRKNVAVYGGFTGDETERDVRDPEANVTILDGRDSDDPVMAERAEHVVTAEEESLLDGFLVTNGRALEIADDYGAGVRVEGVALTLRNMRFEENIAYSGGALSCREGSLRIENGLFVENTARYGGALDAVNCSVSAIGTVFRKNEALSDGGAWNIEKGSVLIEDSEFVECEAYNAGAILASSVDGLFIGHTRFVNNRASSDYGTIRLRGYGKSEVENSEFAGNYAYGFAGSVDYVGLGNEPSLMLSNNLFLGNVSDHAGQEVRANNGIVYLERNRFVVLDDGSSGSIYVFYGMYLGEGSSVKGNLFAGCHFGGCLRFDNDVNIVANTFIVEDPYYGPGAIKKGSIVGNILWGYELGPWGYEPPELVVFGYNDSKTLEDESIIGSNGNISSDPLFSQQGLPAPGKFDGYGLYNEYNEEKMSTVLRDSTASWEPGALAGLVIEVRSTQDMNLDPDQWLYVYDNSETELFILGDLDLDMGTRYRFQNYHLSAESPCIDAGYGNLGPETDLDGNPRVDVESVENTGYGDIDYYDIGAFEYQPVQ